MSIENKKVYAIIASWNGAEWIAQAVESLQGSTVPVHIVVIDNASSDETVAIVKKSFEDVEVLSMPENLGFARANNHGMRYALSRGADYLLLLNQDAKVSPDTVKALVAISENHQDFGIISPLHLTYHGEKVEPTFFSFIKDTTELISDGLLKKMHDLYEVDFVNAAIWLVSRKAIERVGGFDPIFFMYGEDNDYCTRARYHGFKVGVTPAAVAFHVNGGNSGREIDFSRQCLKLISQIIHRLKRPDHIFILSCLGLVVSWAQRAVLQLMDCDFKGFAATALSFTRVALKLFPVWQHYRQCRRPGASWL